jgi:hypothetical protein
MTTPSTGDARAEERVEEAVIADLGLLFKDDFGCNSDRCCCMGIEAFECKAGFTVDKIARAAIEAYRKAMREQG